LNENNYKTEKNTIGIPNGAESWAIAIISIDKPIKRINFK
jgi:hypothetical protein